VRRVLLLFLLALPLYGKSLHWRAVDIDARLDRDGRLHVTERQTMVFDGDWNGGERVFHGEGNQTFTWLGMRRIEGARVIPMREDDLDAVDEYEFASSDTVRWRARLATDPEFANKELTYELSYTWGNVLQPLEGNAYRLAHDFAAENRPGPIERFRLRLDFDPVWRQQPLVVEQPLPVGATVVAHRDLVHPGTPASIDRPGSRKVAVAIAASMLAALALLVLWFFAREKARRQRIEPHLDESVFALRPEVASAALLGTVGPHAVAALLARLTQEGVIRSRVKDDELHITRGTVAAESYAATLLDRMFVAGDRRETNTALIRSHYAGEGFDPAAVIAPRINEKLSALPGWETHQSRVPWLFDITLLAGGLGALIAAMVTGGNTDVAAGALALLFCAMSGIFGCVVAAFNARAITRLRLRCAAVLATLVPAVLYVLICAVGVREFSLHAPILAAMAALVVVIANFALDLLRTPESAERLALRRRLAAAKAYFAQQLRTSDPRLQNEWLPWLLGFGLGKHVDRWFRSYGSTESSHSGARTSTSSSTSEPSTPRWTGGGGAFGGAGATGTWAVAAGAMAQGVSPPASSSGSGGGSSSSSSSSSSSGGGSMGGW
jgi:uncharacterized membrane protein YgcG